MTGQKRKKKPGKNSWVLDGKKREKTGKNRFWTGFSGRPGKNTLFRPKHEHWKWHTFSQYHTQGNMGWYDTDLGLQSSIRGESKSKFGRQVLV